jgi:hypothetical protein
MKLDRFFTIADDEPACLASSRPLPLVYSLPSLSSIPRLAHFNNCREVDSEAESMERGVNAALRR